MRRQAVPLKKRPDAHEPRQTPNVHMSFRVSATPSSQGVPLAVLHGTTSALWAHAASAATRSAATKKDIALFCLGEKERNSAI